VSRWLDEWVGLVEWLVVVYKLREDVKIWSWEVCSDQVLDGYFNGNVVEGSEGSGW
jgi:hypothetical protein